MLRRKYRKMPADITGFERKFGWSAIDASALLTEYGGKLSERSAVQGLKILAGEYADWFRREPEKTHLFPLRASIFQYWFARGVRDALGLKARLRTMATFTDPVMAWEMAPQAQKLKLEKGVVIHDFDGGGITRGNIARAADLFPGQIETHSLTLQQDKAQAKVPVFGTKVLVRSHFIAGKKIDLATKKIDLSPTEKGLSEKQAAFIKRAVYAAGVASARELLKEKK